MQVNKANSTQTPNFGRLIITPEAKKTLKMMSNNCFYKINATKLINKLVDAQEHLEHYNWSDVIVDVKKSKLIPIISISTLLTAPCKSAHAVECYRKNAIISDDGNFYSQNGDTIKEGDSYDFNQAEEQESLEKALEIADINEKLGNEAEKKKYLLSTKDKLKKLGIE